MVATARLGLLVGVLAFCAGCGNTDLPAPPSPIQAPSPVVPPPAVEIPPLSGPSTGYHFSGSLLYPVSPATTTSEYALYENGAFSLHYPWSPAGGGTAVGIYQRDGNTINFRFVPGGHQSTATGTLKGDLLEVRYSELMQHADYEDAVYRRSQ